MSHRQTLPLPPNFFPCPPLHDDDVTYLKHLAIATATEVVDHSQLRDGGIAWTLRSDEGNMRFFKASDPLHRAGAHMYMSVVEVAGTLDEVIDLFRTDTTFKAKEYVKRFGKGLLDAVNLYSIVEPTPDFPNEKVGITWFAMKSPFDKIVANRDCVMLECQHEFQWTTDRRAWVRGLRSVDMACCPDMQSTLGLVRSTQYGVGHVVLESLDRPGYLQISFLNHFDVKGNPPEWLIEMGMKKRCKSVVDIELYLREDRLGRGFLLSPAEFVPVTRRRHCFLCRKRFNPWSKRSNCMKCGEVLCRGCNSSWNVKLHNGTVPAVIQACIRCAQTNPNHPCDATDATSSITRSLASNPQSHNSIPRSHDSHPFHPHHPLDPAIAASSSSSDGSGNKTRPGLSGMMQAAPEPFESYPPHLLQDPTYSHPSNNCRFDSRASIVSSASSASVWTTSSDLTKKLMPRFLSSHSRAPQHQLHGQATKPSDMDDRARRFGWDNGGIAHRDEARCPQLNRQDNTSRRSADSQDDDDDDDGASQQDSRASVWLTLSQGRGGEFVVHSPTSTSMVEEEWNPRDMGFPTSPTATGRRQAAGPHRSSSLDMTTMSLIPSMMGMIPHIPLNHRTLRRTQQHAAGKKNAANNAPDAAVVAVAAAAAAWTTAPSRPSVAASSVDSSASDDLHVLSSQWTVDPSRFRRGENNHAAHEGQNERAMAIEEASDGGEPVRSVLCTSPHGPIYLE